MSENPSEERCAHVLCGRAAIERLLDDAECALSDCPFQAKPTKPPEELSPLARAVKEARGGDAPTQFRGFA